MKTLVIHPKDYSTRFLSVIYEGKDYTVVDKNISKKALKQLILTHDRIIMLGHGSEQGLFGYNKLVIDSNLVYLLRDKVCICVWCNANVFVEKYQLKGFYTGMIISEYGEAIDCCVSATYEQILNSNVIFAEALKKSIDTDNILENMKLLYQPICSVSEFNHQNLFQNDNI